MWISRKKYEELVKEKAEHKSSYDIYVLKTKLTDCEITKNQLIEVCVINENRIKELEAQLAKKEDSKLPFVVIHCTAESEKEQPKEKEVEVNPYYFERKPYPREFIVTEICDLMGNNIKIGSLSCRQCKNCIANNGDDFIKCKLKPEGKAKKTERFKRDEYGVISEVQKNDDPCVNCVYFNLDSTSKICIHCQKNHSDTEYYSSK